MHPSTATSFHQLDGQQLEMYGLGALGDIDSMVYGGLVDEDGDLYQTAVITYDLDGTLSSARQVMLLFGGHLAAGGGPRSWGAGNGASDINGGPYHIKLTQVDGAAIGNRDNQIMSSAILPLSVTVSTTLHQTTAAGADLSPANNGTTLTLTMPADGTGVYVKDYATASDPFATGTVTFRYYTSEASCLADLTGAGGTTAGSGALSGGTASGSTLHFTAIATYYFRAFLIGTDITLDAISPCDEILTLNQATTTATLLHERTNSGGDTDVSPSNNGKNIERARWRVCQRHRDRDAVGDRNGDLQDVSDPCRMRDRYEWDGAGRRPGSHCALHDDPAEHGGHRLLACVLHGHRREPRLEQPVRPW